MPLVDRERLLHGNWNIRVEGNFMRRDWFTIVDEAPADLDSVSRAWDEAASDSSRADYTVGAKVGHKAGVWFVLDVVRERATPAGVDALIDQCAALDGWRVPIDLQQEPGSAGKARVDNHRRRLKGFDVRVAPPTGDKVTRAKPLASALEAGNLRLVRGDWNVAFINECVAFPGGPHDDQVDAASWAMLMQAHGASMAPLPAGSRVAEWIGSASMDGAYDDSGAGAGADDDLGGVFIGG